MSTKTAGTLGLEDLGRFVHWQDALEGGTIEGMLTYVSFDMYRDEGDEPVFVVVGAPDDPEGDIGFYLAADAEVNLSDGGPEDPQ